MKLYVLTSTDRGYYDDSTTLIEGVYSTKDRAELMKRRVLQLHDYAEITEVELDEHCEEENK